MKIVDSASGEAYLLDPDTVLDIERTNPFFNEYGEQSEQVSIPDTPKNRILIGQVQEGTSKAKPLQSASVIISDGDYIMPARRVILSTEKKAKIEMAFYMNEGSFFSLVQKTSLSSVFGDETIPGITTIAQALTFCQNLLTTSDERLTIFPVLVDSETSTKRTINSLKFMDAQGVIVRYPYSTELHRYLSLWEIETTPGFYNAFERKETVEDQTYTIPAGYYISPFIKANYLLKRILQYFGYTLDLDGSFLSQEPFASWAFVNNTVDTLVKGVIRFSDIIPTCNCNDILNIYRCKFHGEFIPDELTKTIRFVQFDEVANSRPTVNLTPHLTSQVKIDFPSSYKQIRLSSSDKISDNDTEEFDSARDLFAAYPTAVVDDIDQCFYRTGLFSGIVNHDRVGLSSIPYQAEKTVEIQEVESPDCMPVMIQSEIRSYSFADSSSTRTQFRYVPLLYIGQANTINGKLRSDQSDETIIEDTTKNPQTEQKPILAFSYDANGYGFKLGTISCFDIKSDRIFDYSLCYHGEWGLYEKFYRKYDELLRNSLHTAKAELLLSNTIKRSLPSHEKILLDGMELFINNLKYNVGGADDPNDCEFFTTQLYSPVVSAQAEASRLQKPAYKWIGAVLQSDITESQYNNSPYKERITQLFFPEHPTAVGQTITHYSAKKISDNSFRLYTYTYTSVAY